MKFLDLMDISESGMELANPTSPEKILRVGRALGLGPGSRAIDFGCGFGEALALWGEQYGIQGVGIEIREKACERARRKIDLRGLAGRIEIVCGQGDEYRFRPGDYQAAACLGASFIWGGFQPAVRAMKAAIHPQGKLAIGEPYWIIDPVPEEIRKREKETQDEYELLNAARQEGFDVETIVRASQEDWDRYQSNNWNGLLRWIEENPDHPERAQVIEHLHASQEDYFRYRRQNVGWAIYVLNPRKYS